MDCEPRPRGEPWHYEAFVWNESSRLQLQPHPGLLALNLVELLEQRETGRDFSAPVSEPTLGSFLWLACRNRSLRSSRYGIAQESRVHPSAGAMHPIHTLVLSRPGAWHRYNPVLHELGKVAGSEAAASSTYKQANEVVPVDHGTILALVAEPGKTQAKYENAESLVWRDAGVVLGYMSVVAQALGLSFCPLGITGHPITLGGWAPAEQLTSVGLALLGVPSTDTTQRT